MNDRAPSIEPSAPRSPSVTCSGQVLPRHTGGAPYRCSLPGLAGFDASRCVGPNLQRRPVRLIQHKRPSRREFNPAIADCGLQGTATSPSSTAKASVVDKGSFASLAPSAARSTYGEYASRAAFRRRLATDPFSPTDKVCGLADINTSDIARERMAEGVGFEPTVQLPVHGISSAAPSATRPPLPSGRRRGSRRITRTHKFTRPQIWRRGEDLNPRGTCAPIRFRVGRLQPGSATPPRNVFNHATRLLAFGTSSPRKAWADRNAKLLHRGERRPSLSPGARSTSSGPFAFEELA